jgi:phosphatidylglycerophosphatase A
MEVIMMALFKVSNIFKNLKAKYKPSPPIPEAVWQNPFYFIAFGLGSGAIPFAPGTFGTLMAIPFYLLLEPLSLPYYIVCVAIFIAASIWLCDRISDAIHVHDHPGMCIDEFAGFFVTMINAPHGWQWIALGFVLFRIFDIWKPWPINVIDEKVPGGLGMELDDIVAGIFSLVIIQIVKIII